MRQKRQYLNQQRNFSPKNQLINSVLNRTLISKKSNGKIGGHKIELYIKDIKKYSLKDHLFSFTEQNPSEEWNE